MNPPANWYEDPTGRHGQRYWDGEQWTEHVFTDGVQGVDPLDAGPAGAAADEAADPGSQEVDADEVAVDEAAVDETGVHAAVDEAAVDEGGVDAAPAPLPQRGTNVHAEREPSADEPVEGLFDDTATPREAGPAAEPAGHMWTPDEAPQQAGTGPDAEGTTAEDADGEVAPEVQAEDVVAALDEVADTDADAAHGSAATGAPGQDDEEGGSGPSPVGDLSDAFVLAPETVSRLVGRRQAAQPDQASTPRVDEQASPAEEPAADEQLEQPAAAHQQAPGGAIDAPPPSMPAPAADSSTGTGHGITGDLVSGAFAERSEGGPVSLQNSRLLRCAVGEGSGVVARQGTMVAYQGDVSFERQGAGGVTRALKRAATGEGLAMMRVEGAGDVFFADGAQHVFLLHLDGGPGLSVNGRNVLAFSAALQWDIERVKGATLLAGGLFNTTLTGTGWVALVSDGEPVVLRTEEAPTHVDVNALVAWSAGLSTRIVNTVSAKSLVGLGSGEAFQMAFDGAGVVIVQPSEGATAGATAS